MSVYNMYIGMQITMDIIIYLQGTVYVSTDLRVLAIAESTRD